MRQKCVSPRLEQRSRDEIGQKPGCKLRVSGWAAKAEASQRAAERLTPSWDVEN